MNFFIILLTVTNVSDLLKWHHTETTQNNNFVQSQLSESSTSQAEWWTDKKMRVPKVVLIQPITTVLSHIQRLQQWTTVNWRQPIVSQKVISLTWHSDDDMQASRPVTCATQWHNLHSASNKQHRSCHKMSHQLQWNITSRQIRIISSPFLQCWNANNRAVNKHGLLLKEERSTGEGMEKGRGGWPVWQLANVGRSASGTYTGQENPLAATVPQQGPCGTIRVRHSERCC